MPLADEDIRAIVARADELQRFAAIPQEELESLVRAGEELGITKAAMERALRERLGTPADPPKVGELTFAKSTDDKYYVALVESSSGEDFRVRFLRGGERILARDELRPCAFLPGERVVCPWPSWGPWTCTVLNYDVADRRITVTDGWGETRSFPIGDVWLAPRTVSTKRRLHLYTALVGIGATVGAAVGALITALLLS